jgi:small conductance mechanosensitive channel
MLSYLAFASDAASGSSNYMDAVMFWKSAGFTLFLSRILTGILVLIVGWIILKIVLSVLRKLLNKSKKTSDLLNDYLIKIIGILGWIMIIITVLSQFGLDMAPLIAGLGITGVVLGLALKDSIANFFAGFMIILNEPFRKNDYVEIGSLSGSVLAMDLMCVRLRTPDGKYVTISNNLVWATPVTNYSNIDKRRLSLVVGVPYDTDLQVAQKVFVDLINTYTEVLSDPVPTVVIVELADSSINFGIRPWVKPEDFWSVSFKFNSEITGKLAEKNIFLPFPQLDVNIQK